MKLLFKYPKKIFLIDAIGAIVSFLMHAILLPYYKDFFGIQNYVLYPLAALAFCFIINSFYQYFNYDSNWPSKLKMIAFINLAYCLISISILVILYDRFEAAGILYFILEVLTILGLAFLELKNSVKR